MGLRLLALLVAALMGVALAGCGSSTPEPPKELSSKADQVQSEINSAKDEIKKARESFTAEISKPSYKFMSGYSDADKHVTMFTAADAKVADAEKHFTDKVRGPLGSYDPSKQSEIISALDSVQKQFGEAKSLAGEPSVWIKRVATAKKDPQANVIKAAEAAFAPHAGTEASIIAAATTAKTNWPHQAQTIDDRVAKASRELKAAGDSLAKLKAEAAKPTPNYAAIVRYADEVSANVNAFQKSDGTIRKQLAELGTTETRTVVDISVEGDIEVGRTSWDEASEWDTENDFDYPPVHTTDAEVISYFSQIQPGTMIASDGASTDFRTESGVDRGMWDKLGIDSRKDWPSWDNAAEYTLDEVSATTCYKLKVMRNGMPDSSGRPPADQNECDKHNNAADLRNGIYWDESEDADLNVIGMDIYSKGAGDFADQATTGASPPGIVYVGDTSTGQWQRDSNGNEFWAFYGQYMFISQLIGGPSPFYSRNEYDTWNRHHRRSDRDYYGGTAASPRFGAGSPYVGSRFPNSQFSKSKLGSPSVRSAGPTLRGGGPGGGGK